MGFNSKTALMQITLPKNCYFMKKNKKGIRIFYNSAEIESE
jgi:hypothetical protein